MNSDSRDLDGLLLLKQPSFSAASQLLLCWLLCLSQWHQQGKQHQVYCELPQPGLLQGNCAIKFQYTSRRKAAPVVTGWQLPELKSLTHT